MLLAVVAALGIAWAGVRCVGQATAPTSAPAPAAPDRLAQAREVTQAIQAAYWDATTGRYRKSLTERGPDFMWGHGIMFSALVGAARHEPATYRPVLEKCFAGLEGYWDTKAAVPGYEPAPTRGNGHDKYYDDNAWMVITFLEAYELTQDAKYLTRARQTLRFVLSGWDEQLGGGIWWHHQHKDDSKNTCVNAPAAVGCLRLAQYEGAEEFVPWASRLVAWTVEHLQDPRDGLYYDHQKVTTGQVGKGKLTYNTALMLRAELGLYRATGEAKYLDEAKRLGKASEWFARQPAGVYRDNVKWAHLLVEADLALYRATGDEALLARARRQGDAWYAKWKDKPPAELIEQASIARTLWLLADQDTEVGRAFWAKLEDRGAKAGRETTHDP